MAVVEVKFVGIDAVTEVMTGGLRRIGEAAVNLLGSALSSVGNFAAESFQGALEAQQGMDELDASLRRAQAAASEQAAAFAEASKTTITGTAASQETLAKWESQLAKAQAKFTDLQERLKDKTPTETQKIQLEELQGTISNLSQQIQNGSQVVTTNLAKSLGLVAPAAVITREEIDNLADQFKNLVGGSDDAVLAMANVGLRFDKISAETFPQFIQQSADLAAVLKTDPVKASEILGKALQDLSVDGQGSIGRLKAAGVAFTDEQEKLIESLVKSGDVAGAQQVLFDALAATTGGAAAAAAGTAAGQWAIFKETIADAGEGVALALLPALTQLASDVLPKLVPIIEDVAGALSGFLQFFLEGDIAAAFDNLGEYETFQEIFKALGISIYEVGPAVEDFAAKVQEFLVNQVVPAFQSAVAWIQENWPAIQAAIADGWAQAQPILQAIGDFIVNVVIPAFNQAVQWVIVNWPAIQATIATVMAQIQAVIATVLAAINAFWSEWGDEIMAFTAGVFEYFSNIFSAFSKAFSGDWRGFGEDLKKAWDLLWEAIKEIAGNAVEWFNTVDWGAVGEAIMQGIADGISAGAQWIMDAAQSAAQAAVDAVKGFLGIESPSKVFAGIGQNMMAGMSEGIMGGMGSPTAAAQRVSNQIANTVNSGGNTINYYGVQADMQYAYNRAVAGAF